MGGCVAVPPFSKNYNVAQQHNGQTIVTNDTQHVRKESETYKVYCNASSDVESSTWVAIKNRRKKPKPGTNRIKTTRYNV
ncbi:unnamed protein product, partial [Rotaria magnacalcarata]